ncbi:MAG TPA: phosphate ABC transporter, permease protein PstA, partial [Halomonas sp.]|nr:phosphate ABC transporter, permease protein PstA [Halomonas sp.]
MRWLPRPPRLTAMGSLLWPWLCAASVALSLLMLATLLTLLAARGLGHFWPATLEEVTLRSGETVIGQ